MKYLGIDVHSSASVWCLLDQDGKSVDRGRVATTAPALQALGRKLSRGDQLLAGHEVGTQVYLVHDAFTDIDIPIEAFNAAHLRMIASSRKKTDKRDAYWIARSLQTGMKPHPVYIPRGQVRELRSLLAQRGALLEDRKRWQSRARAELRGRGVRLPPGKLKIQRHVDFLLEHPDGVEASLLRNLGRCERSMSMLDEELAHLEGEVFELLRGNEVVARLRTIPGVGELVSAHLYAAIADIGRFPNARALASYAGLVPSVRNTADVSRYGHITKEGSPALRRVLVQAAHVVARSTSEDAAPLRAIHDRVCSNRGRKKIAKVALARHLLKLTFYVWRDGTTYDPKRLRCPTT